MVLLDDSHLTAISQAIGPAPATASSKPCWWQLAVELGFDEPAIAKIKIEQERRLGRAARGESVLNEACALQVLRMWRDQLKASLERKCALLHKAFQALELSEMDRDLCSKEYEWLALL